MREADSRREMKIGLGPVERASGNTDDSGLPV